LSVFAALPVGKRYETRQRIIQAVKSGEVKRDFFLPLKGVTMHLPMEIKGFTDFLCSKEHLNNVRESYKSRTEAEHV
jgi:fumarylacetoacetase